LNGEGASKRVAFFLRMNKKHACFLFRKAQKGNEKITKNRGRKGIKKARY
jgi:hypothetical protein